MEVSRSKVKSEDTLESLRFLYGADTERFKEAFHKIYAFDLDTVPEESLQGLADLSETGADKLGEIENIKFSVVDVMNSIKVRDAVIEKNIEDKNLILID